MTEVRRFAGSPYLEYTQKLEGDRFGAAGRGRREHPRITDYVQLRVKRHLRANSVSSFWKSGRFRSGARSAFFSMSCR